MADYCCYPTTLSGSIEGPPKVVDAIDDVSAIVRAHEILPEQPFEVWQGARRVYQRAPIRRRLAGVG